MEGLVSLLLFAGAALAQDSPVDWEGLSDEQREVLTPFDGSWQTLDAERQQRLASGAQPA